MALVALLLLVLAVYALVDCLRTTGSEVRGLPAPVWVAIIVLLPLVGPAAWLVAGRSQGPTTGGRRPAAGRPGPKGPDDDPDFLRSLDPKHRDEA